MPERSTDATIALGRELIESWNARAEQPLVATHRRTFLQPQLAIVHGLAAHTYYLAAPALDLLDERRALAAMPLVRAAYESAITAQWAAQIRDGFAAFMNEDLRQRRNHASAMARAASEVFRVAAPTLHGIDFVDLPTSASSRAFESVCADLAEGGADAYVTYRMMSHLSHASVMVVDEYITGLPDPPGLALRMQPNEPNRAPWARICVSTLVWAGRAIEFLEKRPQRRSQLLAAARTLGIPPHLHPSDSAVVREQRPS